MFRADHAGAGKKGSTDPEFVLGPTHEEVITPLVKAEVSSYRDLPKNFFQIATKAVLSFDPRPDNPDPNFTQTGAEIDPTACF